MDFDGYGYKKKKPSAFGYFLAALLGAVLGGLLLLTFAPSALLSKTQQMQQTNQNTQQSLPLQSKSDGSISDAANRIIPSVVGITSTSVQKSMFGQNKRVEGVGSGIIVDKGGYILTNNHVADASAKSLTVSLYDGRETRGTVVWSDSALDLAIVRIESTDLPVANLGDSKLIKIGEPAIAIGNPLGLKFERTVTAGIISALNRTVEISEGSFMEVTNSYK